MKSHIKMIFSKIGLGFCYGIGFGIALSLVIMFFNKYESKLSPSINDEQQYASADIRNQLIKEHKLISKSGKIIEIIGLVDNNTEYEWSPLKIEIEFFDEKGTFVYECSDYIEGGILPFTKEHFKVSCSSCDGKLPDFSTYEIKIASAYGTINSDSTTSR